MKKGMSLTELASEIERQHNASRDFVAPSTLMTMQLKDREPRLIINAQEPMDFAINHIAHEQMAQKLDIPKRYYDRMMREDPELLQHNVNVWLGSEDTPRMVRTLDNTARAFLSNSYRPIDNILIANAALPILAEMEELEIVSCEITDRRLYISAVTSRIQSEVKLNDIVQMGVTISNSEVGNGNVRIEPLIYRLICHNGMVRSHAMKRRHVGKKLGMDDGILSIEEFYRDETMEASDRALLLQMRDTVRHSFDEIKFAEEVDRLREAADVKLESTDLQSVVKEVSRKFVLSKEEGNGVLSHLINGGDLSKWGLANAVTRLANDDEVTYDRAYELQKVGSNIIDLTKKDWKTINR